MNSLTIGLGVIQGSVISAYLGVFSERRSLFGRRLNPIGVSTLSQK